MGAKSLIESELILAIDFDGTISTEPDIGKPLELQFNAKEVLTRLHEDGAKLILWTCRTGAHLDEALKFLQDNNMLHLFDKINDQLDEVIEKYSPDVARKVGADIYYDDKSAMTEINWEMFEKFIYGGN